MKQKYFTCGTLYAIYKKKFTIKLPCKYKLRKTKKN